MMNFQQPQPVAGRGQMRSFAPAPATTTPATPGQQQPRTPAAPSFSQQDLDRSRTQAQGLFTQAQKGLSTTQSNIEASLKAEQQAELNRQSTIKQLEMLIGQSNYGYYDPLYEGPIKYNWAGPIRSQDLSRVGQRVYDRYLNEQSNYMPRWERNYRLAEAQKELGMREAALGTVESDYYRDLERRQAQYYEGGMGRGGQTYGQDLGTFYG